MEQSNINTGEQSLVLIGCDEEEISEGMTILTSLFTRYVTLLDEEHHQRTKELESPNEPNPSFPQYDQIQLPRSTLKANTTPTYPPHRSSPRKVPTDEAIFVNHPSSQPNGSDILTALLPPPVKWEYDDQPNDQLETQPVQQYNRTTSPSPN